MTEPSPTADLGRVDVPCRAAVLLVPEIADMLRVGKRAVYEMIESGRLPCIRIGKSIRVPRAAVERFIEGSVGQE